MHCAVAGKNSGYVFHRVLTGPGGRAHEPAPCRFIGRFSLGHRHCAVFFWLGTRHRLCRPPRGLCPGRPDLGHLPCLWLLAGGETPRRAAVVTGGGAEWVCLLFCQQPDSALFTRHPLAQPDVAARGLFAVPSTAPRPCRNRIVPWSTAGYLP